LLPPVPEVPDESGEAVPPVLLMLGDTVGVGVDVGVGVAVGVGVEVAEAPVVGADEAGAVAVGLAAVPAGVVGQPAGAVSPVAAPGDGLAEADGVALPAPPSGELPAVAVGVTGSQDAHGAEADVTPGCAAVCDGSAVPRARRLVLTEAPLTVPARLDPPLALSGPPPKLGASAWVPPVSTDEPT
jgi:hypothetical protein